jgi:putative transposase
MTKLQARRSGTSEAFLAEAGELVARIGAICDEFECYGYRRVGAALCQQGVVVNGKKLRRLMREYDPQPKRRRRYVTTTDSDHAGPIFADLAIRCRCQWPQPALGG